MTVHLETYPLKIPHTHPKHLHAYISGPRHTHSERHTHPTWVGAYGSGPRNTHSLPVAPLGSFLMGPFWQPRGLAPADLGHLLAIVTARGKPRAPQPRSLCATHPPERCVYDAKLLDTQGVIEGPALAIHTLCADVPIICLERKRA